MTQSVRAIVGDQVILDRCARDVPLPPIAFFASPFLWLLLARSQYPVQVVWDWEVGINTVTAYRSYRKSTVKEFLWPAIFAVRRSDSVMTQPSSIYGLQDVSYISFNVHKDDSYTERLHHYTNYRIALAQKFNRDRSGENVEFTSWIIHYISSLQSVDCTPDTTRRCCLCRVRWCELSRPDRPTSTFCVGVRPAVAPAVPAPPDTPRDGTHLSGGRVDSIHIATSDTTVQSVSCLMYRYELDDCSERVQTSNFLSATALSCRESNSHCRGRHDTDRTVLSGLAWRCELGISYNFVNILKWSQWKPSLRSTAHLRTRYANRLNTGNSGGIRNVSLPRYVQVSAAHWLGGWHASAIRCSPRPSRHQCIFNASWHDVNTNSAVGRYTYVYLQSVSQPPNYRSLGQQ